MYLRTLIGPYAGQVLDFSPEAASAMLADGRAVHPDDDLSSNESEAEALEGVIDHTDEHRATSGAKLNKKGRRA